MSTFFIFIFIHIYRKVFINISILYRCKKIKTGGKSIKHRKEKTMKKHEIIATALAALVTTAANIVIIRNAVTNVKAIIEEVKEEAEEEKKEEEA